MKRNPIIRKLDRLSARFLLSVSYGMIRIIPRKFFYSFGIGLGTFAYYILPGRRRITLNNLKLAFEGSKSEAECRRIAKDVFKQLAIGGSELIITALYDSVDDIKKNIEIEGLENLKKALEQGKGAIALSAHFGNFTLMCVRLAQENFHFKTIMRDFSDEGISDFFHNKRKRFNVELIFAIPRKECVTNAVEHLRQNGVLCLLADQSKNSGLFVNFFGQLAGTAAGPAVMAIRTGAPIVPVFILKQGLGKHKIVIHPPLDVALSGHYKKDVFNITQKFTAIIEDYTRRFPEQWWWVHERWKHIPKKDDK